MMPEPAVGLSEASREAWDEALGGLAGRTFCHLAGWREVFDRAFGHETIRLAAHDAEGALVGLLPLVRMRSRIFGHNLVSMPFLNYGGPVGSPPARRALATYAEGLARSTGAGLLELRCRDDFDLGLPISREKITVLLPLPTEPERLWTDGLKAKVRSQVRRPMKAGMSAHFGREHMAEFYGVFCENMRDLGTPVLSNDLFGAISTVFSEELVVCVIRGDGRAVAGGVGFLYDGEFELTWASSSRRHAREAPNMLLYWSLMEEVIRRGASTFNFGRCSPGGGTHRFKLQWGGSDAQLHWSRWSRSGAATPPSVDNPAYKAAAEIWRRLPLPVANALGPLVSGSLPSF